MTDLFDVLADETRRAIISCLDTAPGDVNGGPVELSVGELVDHVGMTQPTVSKHLKVLREQDIVRVREEGQHRYYRLNPEALAPVAAWLGDVVGKEFVGEASDHSHPLEMQQPYVDLRLAGVQVGSFLGDARDAVLSLIGRRF